MDKKDIFKFQIKMYETLNCLLPGKLELIKKYLPTNVSEVFIDELEDVINDLKNCAYEYRQFDKDLNAFLGYIESDEKKDESI